MCEFTKWLRSMQRQNEMRQERAPHLTLFYLSGERGGGGEGHTHTSKGSWVRGVGVDILIPLEQDIRTGAHHRYLFGHHYGNNISRK